MPVFPCKRALALSLLSVTSAHANGAFPAVSQLVADPSDTTHLVLRSNFGVLTTRDRGKTWDLVCEAGVGYVDIDPPMISEQLGMDCTAASAVTPKTDCSDNGSAGAAGDSPGGSAGEPAPPAGHNDRQSGNGCSLGAPAPTGPKWLAAFLAALAVARVARRRSERRF